MFVHFNRQIHNSDLISSLSIDDLVTEGIVTVYMTNGHHYNVSGPEAFNLVMGLCPNALEGMNAKYHKHAWAVHNLIGHPLMQVCAWLHLTSLGLKIHDMTVPNPKV